MPAHLKLSPSAGNGDTLIGSGVFAFKYRRADQTASIAPRPISRTRTSISFSDRRGATPVDTLRFKVGASC